MLSRGFLAIQISRQFGSIIVQKELYYYGNAALQPSVQHWPY